MLDFFGLLEKQRKRKEKAQKSYRRQQDPSEANKEAVERLLGLMGVGFEGAGKMTY